MQIISNLKLMQALASNNLSEKGWLSLLLAAKKQDKTNIHTPGSGSTFSRRGFFSSFCHLGFNL
ncbi:hypothetical protein DB42_BQ00350 [Neochlamydia sp. EPS4]|nr:hypothetical protein DB42_BQ00350 [Neochlamydia sp. EPS4]